MGRWARFAARAARSVGPSAAAVPLASLAAAACALTLAAATAGADLLGHGAPVRDVALASDGSRAITSGFDDVAIVWRLEDESQIVRLYGHEAAVNAGAFLPDGRAVTVSDDGSARIWSLESGESLSILTGHSQKVVNVAVSPDGALIATASWDRTVRLWDAGAGAERAVFDGHEGPVNAVLFVDGGRRLLSAGYDGALRLWPVADDAGDAELLANAGFPINDMALAPDGRLLATASADGVVRLWDLETQSELRALAGHKGAVLAVAISPDGGAIASGGTDGHLLMWRRVAEEADDPEAPILDVPIEHYRAVWALAFRPDGEVIYASGVDRVTRAFSAVDGTPIGGAVTPFQPIERVSRALRDSEDPVERGGFQFRKCAVCHSLAAEDTPRSGPTLYGIFGRTVGGLEGYNYSPALEAADFIWTEETVSELFEVGPDVMLPGTKMPIQRLPDPQDRADLMAFLREATAVAGEAEPSAGQ